MKSKNPDRGAWAVIWGGFFVFLALCLIIPLGIRYYVRHATVPKEATLEVIGGTVRVKEPGVAAPLAVTRSVRVPEGTAIETDENSRGILTFLDGSTAILFTATQITLREMHVSTFPWGTEPVTIIIDQDRGRLRIGAAPQIPQEDKSVLPRQFKVVTPHLVAALSEGSYAVEVMADTSQVSVRDGMAQVQAQAKATSVGRAQRTVVRRNEPPQPPGPATQDIIVNGDFKDPRSRGWNDSIESPGTPSAPAGKLSNPMVDNRLTLRIERSGANQTSAITGIIQQINREVSDYRALRLAADVRVHLQSLSGGGILSSEYPVILRLKYRDVNGGEAEYVHGFYSQNLTNNPTLNGELVPQDVWFPFESGNLLEALDPRPFFLTSLQIYASGWDYDSSVTGIRLILE